MANLTVSTGIENDIKTLDVMSVAELDAKLQHSYSQALAGEGHPLESVFDELEQSLG